MKYIKTYENVFYDIEIGDYVIANSDICSKFLSQFFDTHIGVVNKISSDRLIITVKYDGDDVMKHDRVILHDNTWNFFNNQILYYSKNKNDLELIIQTNKYNL